jgi:hypothetical protein
MKFWMPWGVAATVTGVAVFFFLAGLADGSVSSFNAGPWTLLLLGTVGVTVGSLMLKRRGRPGLGALLALVLALPGVLAGLFLLLTLITQPRWNQASSSVPIASRVDVELHDPVCSTDILQEGLADAATTWPDSLCDRECVVHGCAVRGSRSRCARLLTRRWRGQCARLVWSPG